LKRWDNTTIRTYARDAMPGGGTIVIAAREEGIGEGHASLEPGTYMCLSLTDTGCGMDEETLRKATEPFFTTKGVGRGTGLGLSMVHGVAEQHGGAFSLKSRVGEGTVAEFWLPVATEVTVRDEPEIALRGRSGRDRPLSIVLVDDDPLVLTSTAAMLEDLGHEAVAVCSGSEALDLMHRNGIPDLVITDQVMPNMSGLQLAEAIET
jgi:CheY-like chemotaxis protein